MLRCLRALRYGTLTLVGRGRCLRHSSDIGGSSKDVSVAQDSRYGTSAPIHDDGQKRTARAVALLREAIDLLSLEGREPASEFRNADHHERLIRLPEVMQMTGLRRSAVYEQMQRGTFPRSVKIGPRAATWPESAVQAWIAECLHRR
jgi:predicted DNA-binding transcriptional regulator AlpA